MTLIYKKISNKIEAYFYKKIIIVNNMINKVLIRIDDKEKKLNNMNTCSKSLL